MNDDDNDDDDGNHPYKHLCDLILDCLLACFIFLLSFEKLCGQINTRQTNYICKLSKCKPFCRGAQTHTHSFVPLTCFWIHGQN